MITAAALHHIRLFYGAYFAAMGLVLPYFPVFLEQQGLDAGMIGVMTGLLAAAKVIAPPLAGHVLDSHFRDSRRFVVAAAILAALLAWGIGAGQGIVALALCTFAFGLLWAAILPLTDGLSIAVSEVGIADYGRLRLWGSIGFVIASLAGGLWLADRHIADFPFWLAGLLLVTAVAAWGFPLQAPEAGHDAGAVGRKFPVSFVLLMLTAFLMQASHGAYYGFFSLYLAAHDYSGWQIGSFWVIGVLAEILLMWLWSGRIQRLAPAGLFAACSLLAAVRWLGIGLTTDAWLLVVLQLLHAASFAAFHVGAVAWVRRLAPAGRQTAAQGWYSATGFGLGNTVGIMACGVVVQLAGFAPAFFACAGVAVVAGLVAWRIRP
ncbi:MAG TPA: MFS transporter [Mariprofundaceae bacterium]|nr:MFS transporter [Mariprofundaceae bacterium]